MWFWILDLFFCLHNMAFMRSPRWKHGWIGSCTQLWHWRQIFLVTLRNRRKFSSPSQSENCAGKPQPLAVVFSFDADVLITEFYCLISQFSFFLLRSTACPSDKNWPLLHHSSLAFRLFRANSHDCFTRMHTWLHGCTASHLALTIPWGFPDVVSVFVMVCCRLYFEILDYIEENNSQCVFLSSSSLDFVGVDLWRTLEGHD